MPRFQVAPSFPSSQTGMVLVVSLIFLLLLTLLGVSSMQNATLQEKMSGSVAVRNVSFQTAEAALRAGESAIMVTGFQRAVCGTANSAACLPPTDSTTATGAGAGVAVTWFAAAGGFYAIQNLGTTSTPIRRPPTCASGSSVTMYRVTAFATQGASRTVLESIYANC